MDYLGSWHPGEFPGPRNDGLGLNHFGPKYSSGLCDASACGSMLWAVLFCFYVGVLSDTIFLVG